MNRQELSTKQWEWLLQNHYQGNEDTLHHDVQFDDEYVKELLRFCPVSAVAAVAFFPSYQAGRFIESSRSTEEDEDIDQLEKKYVPVSKIRATQWTVYRDAMEYYREAYRQGAKVKPILAYLDPQTGLYLVKDGHHRLYAHSRLRLGLVELALSPRAPLSRSVLYEVHKMRVTER